MWAGYIYTPGRKGQRSWGGRQGHLRGSMAGRRSETSVNGHSGACSGSEQLPLGIGSRGRCQAQWWDTRFLLELWRQNKQGGSSVSGPSGISQTWGGWQMFRKTSRIRNLLSPTHGLKTKCRSVPFILRNYLMAILSNLHKETSNN